MMCGDRWLTTGSPWEGDEMTEREQFEKWARQSDTNPLLNRADHNGTELDEYHFPLARAMWETWQAARATPALTERIRELEEALANYIAQIDRDNKNAAAPLVVGEKERQKACDALRATPALPQLPEGMAIVPVEPTPKMIVAFRNSNGFQDGYKAMLAAAKEKGE